MSEANGLPSGWVLTTLGKTAHIIMGNSPPGDTYNDRGNGIPLINGPVEFGPEALSRTLKTKFTTAPAKYCEENDLLVCVRGSTTGRTNVAGFAAGIGRGVAAVRAYINQGYVNHYLVSSRDNLFGMGTGSTFPNITQSQLETFPIPVAPLPEQLRIVATLEELLSDLDAGVSALKRAQANLKKYRAAVLKAAVTGELTAEWRAAHPNVEPAAKLLDRILAERRRKWEAEQEAKFAAAGKTPPKGWQAKYPEPCKPNPSTPFQLPSRWSWVTAEQLSDETRSITYGIIKLGKEMENGVPTLRCSNVRHLRLDLDGLKKVDPTIAGEYERTFLRGGEVLVNVRGTLGGVVRVPITCAGYNIAREVAMIDPVDEAISSLLAIFIGSPPLQVWLTQNTRGIAYTGINIEALKMLPIPLPPLAEQRAIVAEVERQLSDITATENYIAASLKRAARLRQSILKEAFAGRLVPQDPNDEPAAKLLERIRQAASGPSSNGETRTSHRRKSLKNQGERGA